MKIQQRLLLLVTALILACVGYAQQPGSTLVVGLSILPTTLDSADANDGNSIAVTRQITERLIELRLGTTELVPGLATSWEANDDSTAWTFHLREGVTFHDGTPFNAEAVKFSLDRWNDEANPYHLSSAGKAYVGWRNLFGGFLGNGSALESVTIDDPYTVTLQLNRSISFLPALLAGGYFGFDSPTAVMAAGAEYGTPAVGSVGTGPYTFGQWEEGSRVVLRANPDYRDGAPATEQVVFVGIGDNTARLAQLKAGAIDVAVGLSSTDLDNIARDPNLQAITGSGGLNTSYLAFHQNQPPFDDVRVRLAVAHAVDRQALVEAFYSDNATAAKDIIPTALWGHTDAEGYAYDPELSRQLLADAGFPNGFDTALWYRNAGIAQTIAEVVATYLADVGIRASVNTEDWAAYLQDYMAGNFPMYMLGWNADFADPDTFVYTFYGPQAVPRFGWVRPDVVELAAKAREVPTQTEREELYGQILTAAYEDAPMLPLTHEAQFLAARTNVSGLVNNPLGGFPPLTGVSKAQ